MNRRSLLLLTTLLGGFAPLGLLAQEPARRSRRRRDLEDAPRTARRAREDEEVPPADDPPPAAADRDDVPPNLPAEAGQQWRSFDIAKYTGLPHKENNPQNSLVDWIFRRTTTAPWHGEKLAVLAAGRSKIRAYHNAKLLDQVAEVVERFVDAQSDYLSLTVRVVAANDTRWRFAVYKRLNLIGTGPQGQQVWTVRPEDAALILNQLQIVQGARELAKKKFDMINGQTANLFTTSPRPYTGGLQRDGAVAQGFQPKAEELEEGVVLRISPLLSYDGDTLDAALELTTNNVRSFHQTRILAPREVGPGEARIDVPEVSETRLNQTVKAWPIGQTLLISAGIQPGILQSKGGLFNVRVPGLGPTGTELLVFLDVKLGDEADVRRGEGSRPRR